MWLEYTWERAKRGYMYYVYMRSFYLNKILENVRKPQNTTKYFFLKHTHIHTIWLMAGETRSWVMFSSIFFSLFILLLCGGMSWHITKYSYNCSSSFPVWAWKWKRMMCFFYNFVKRVKPVYKGSNKLHSIERWPFL